MSNLPGNLSDIFTELQMYNKLDFDMDNFPELYNTLNKPQKLDCFCSECGRESIFMSNESGITEGTEWKDDLKYLRKLGVLLVTFNCSRNSDHKMYFQFIIQNLTIMKIGQLPSIADLSITEMRKYNKILDNAGYRELSKAIGLVSHGVGIGSFVYLRRIFENLIEDAHQQAKDDEDWDELEYGKKRIAERIGLLKMHLPSFLVEHKGLYSILSKGIHELSEEECLEMFPAVKLGIELILDEKLEELERQKKISDGSKALASLVEKYR